VKIQKCVFCRGARIALGRGSYRAPAAPDPIVGLRGSRDGRGTRGKRGKREEGGMTSSRAVVEIH